MLFICKFTHSVKVKVKLDLKIVHQLEITAIYISAFFRITDIDILYNYYIVLFTIESSISTSD